MRWQGLIRAWQHSSDLHRFNPRASLDELAEVEQQLGHALPAALREFYRISNGASLAGGNLKIDELQSRTVKRAEPFINPFKIDKTPESEYVTPGLATETTRLRGYGWPIAAEVLVIGSDGSDSLFGIWLPESQKSVFCHPIVEIAQTFDRTKNMAVVGTSLLPFLYVCTALRLLQYRCDDDALDAIAVPKALRREFSEPSLLARLREWADPNLPDFDPSPYERGIDAHELRQLCASP